MTTEECLRNADFMATMTSVISDDPDRIKKAVNGVEANRSMKRAVRVMGQDSEIRKTINQTKKKDKKKIYNAAKNAGNARQTEGITCVSVRSNNYAKKVFYPIESKMKDTVHVRIDDNFAFIESTLGGKKNKFISSLMGRTIGGDVIIYACSQDSLEPRQDYPQEQFEMRYPNAVYWK